MTDIFGPATAANAVTSRPVDSRTMGANDTWFQDCSSQSADDGTDVEAAFLNDLIGNLRTLARGNGNVVATGAAVVANDNSDGMLLAAVQHLAQRGLYSKALDVGAVNALSIVLSPVPPEFPDGFKVLIKAKYSNTAAASLALAGTVYPIVSSNGNAALAGGEIIAGAWQEYRFDAASSKWQIGTSGIIQAALVHYGTATGTNALAVATVTPAINATLTDGTVFGILPTQGPNTGNVTVQLPNQPGPLPLKYPNGNQLLPGEIEAARPIDVKFIGGTLYLMSPTNPVRAATFAISLSSPTASSNGVGQAFALPTVAGAFCASASTSITFSQEGLYLVIASGTVAVNTSGSSNVNSQVQIFKNGVAATPASFDNSHDVSGVIAPTVQNIAAVVMGVNDTLQVMGVAYASANYVSSANNAVAVTVVKLG